MRSDDLPHSHPPLGTEMSNELLLWQEGMVKAVREMEVGQDQFFKAIKKSEKLRDEGYLQCKTVLDKTAEDSAEALALSREAIARVSGLESIVNRGLLDLSTHFSKELKIATDAIKDSISITITAEATVKKTWSVLGVLTEIMKRMAPVVAGFGIAAVGYHLISQKVETFFNWLFHLRW